MLLDKSLINTIQCAEALAFLRTMPDESIHCVVTSPPYFGLRSYSDNPLEIGKEQTPAEYVAALVEVFREVRRVLRKDGTFWLNIGDSFNGSGKSSGKAWENGKIPNQSKKQSSNTGSLTHNPTRLKDVKAKQLLMIPARVALALQDDGWILRQDIIWHKNNAMPESVTDRPSSSHEHVFLFAKSGRYFYDSEAIKEDVVNGDPNPPRRSIGVMDDLNKGRRKQEESGLRTYVGFNDRWDQRQEPLLRRNKRSVWTINTSASAIPHFAMMPEKLVEPCILAGSAEKCCAVCGAPYKRITKRSGELSGNRPQARRALELFKEKGLTDDHLIAIRAVGMADTGKALVTMDGAGKNTEEIQQLADEAKLALGGYYREFTFNNAVITVGFITTCGCESTETMRGVILDPFSGASTVALVARTNHRDYLGIELNPDNVAWSLDRLRMPLEPRLAPVKDETNYDELPMMKILAAMSQEGT